MLCLSMEEHSPAWTRTGAPKHTPAEESLGEEEEWTAPMGDCREKDKDCSVQFPCTEQMSIPPFFFIQKFGFIITLRLC